MISRLFFTASFFFLTASSLNAEYVVMHSRNAGMFSIWMDVLSLVHGYETGLYDGIEVDFEKEGLYYSPFKGDNWWSYYCEPICLGTKTEIVHALGDPPGVPGPIEHKLDRHLIREYIGKYIHVKFDIMQEIAQYQIDNFVGNYVLSIHYRGTDKIIHEAREVPYADVLLVVDRIIKERGLDKFKIFIATDEENFLNFMIYKYGDKVIYRDVQRSSDGNPLHLENENPYQQGLEALTDAILLSRGHYLIRTSSNLSRWSTFFNPDIPVYELSEMDCH